MLESLILIDPAAGVRSPRTSNYTVRPWTLEDLKAVAHAAGRYKPLI